MKVSTAGAVIGVLALANIALFAAVEASNGADRQVSARADNSLAVVDPTPTATGSAGSTPSPPTGTTAPSAPRVVAVAGGADRAWRAISPAGCGRAVRVQVTTNGGRTWTEAPSPQVRTANGLGFDAAGHLFLTGRSGGECASGAWSLSAGSWAPVVSSRWHRTGEPSADLTLSGRRHQVCTDGWVVDLAVGTSAANVLCSNGDIRAVPARGAVRTLLHSTAVFSIGTAGGNTLVAARTASGCDGVELDKVSDGTVHRITCVQGADSDVDLTFAADAGWLIGADATWTGGLGGTWSKR